MKIQGQTPADRTQNPYGIDKYTKLLLHMEGADEGTTFRDETGKAVTTNGGAKTENTMRRFGATSLWCDGTGDYISMLDSVDWDLDAADYTVDFWVSFSDVSTHRALWGHGTSDDNIHYLYWNQTSKYLYYYGRFAATTLIYMNTTISWTPTLNTWYHIAVVRTGSTCKIFVNGYDQGGDGSTYSGGNLSGLSSVFCVGCEPIYGYIHYGYIDEFRWSKGIARWTANFIPQSRPYGGYAVKDGEMV